MAWISQQTQIHCPKQLEHFALHNGDGLHYVGKKLALRAPSIIGSLQTINGLMYTTLWLNCPNG